MTNGNLKFDFLYKKRGGSKSLSLCFQQGIKGKQTSRKWRVIESLLTTATSSKVKPFPLE